MAEEVGACRLSLRSPPRSRAKDAIFLEEVVSLARQYSGTLWRPVRSRLHFNLRDKSR